MYSERADRARVPVTRRAAAAVASGAFLGAGLLFWACGGTTGHDGETIGASTTEDAATDATLSDGGDADASVAYDAGAFDVDITYADRMLIEAAPSVDGGARADGSGFPLCPGWEQVDNTDGGGHVVIDGYGNAVDGSINGVPIDPSTAVAFIPTDFTADGGIGPAVAGGACATYSWTPDIDLNCGVNAYAGTLNSFSIFPPCNWAIGLGTAVSGPMGGASRYDLCMKVYACVESTRCVTSGGHLLTQNCLCGPNNNNCTAGANGACSQQILDAFELSDFSPANIKIILANFAFVDDLHTINSQMGLVAPAYVSPIFDLYNTAIANGCLIDAGAGSLDAGSN